MVRIKVLFDFFRIVFLVKSKRKMYTKISNKGLSINYLKLVGERRNMVKLVLERDERSVEALHYGLSQIFTDGVSDPYKN